MKTGVLVCLFVAPVFATPLAAEEVTGSEFEADVHGYPCSVTMHTASGTRFTTKLSDYKEVWSLTFFFSGKPQVFLPYFKSNGLQDQDALATKIRVISIGGEDFDLTKVFLYAVQRSEVDEMTALSVSIETEHRVGSVLSAMQNDHVELTTIASLSRTSEAFGDFRSCALDAMGLQDGTQVEVDYREEYRLSFEKAFALWISAANRADSCLVGSLDAGEVEDVIERASSVFYPGLGNLFRRGRYEDDLRGKLTLAAVDGRTAAISDGCLMADSMAEMTEKLVLQAIESAEALD